MYREHFQIRHFLHIFQPFHKLQNSLKILDKGSIIFNDSAHKMPPNQLIKRRFSFSIGIISIPKWSKNPVPVEYCVTVLILHTYC